MVCSSEVRQTDREDIDRIMVIERQTGERPSWADDELLRVKVWFRGAWEIRTAVFMKKRPPGPFVKNREDRYMDHPIRRRDQCAKEVTVRSPNRTESQNLEDLPPMVFFFIEDTILGNWYELGKGVYKHKRGPTYSYEESKTCSSREDTDAIGGGSITWSFFNHQEKRERKDDTTEKIRKENGGTPSTSENGDACMLVWANRKKGVVAVFRLLHYPTQYAAWDKY
ncbi:hypothetical protein GALMADRAFT_275968 [Galerina marginata CBS 339.88]|uniref:Uncharacterized protein n=1 Tax=Galerina marginata (strain CBS 339.88) TaxID=685588 RepID=A0A067TKR2_GALM3|nr:hypothetical protein GALMADRAFT_275968 [Galerina marginata CBS 339.88]